MKKSICFISSYQICPPVEGGQIRIYNIATNLSENFDVKVLTISPRVGKVDKFKIGNMDIINVPELSLLPGAMISKLCKLPVGETLLPYSSQFAFRFRKILKEIVNSSDIIFLERPFLFPLVYKYSKKVKIVYDSHDVEVILKEKVFENNKFIKKFVLPIVQKTEKKACIKSDCIVVPSTNDQRKINEIYKISLEKIHIAPNGVDCLEILFSSFDEKCMAKKKIGLENQTVILFIGSSHPPNIKAAEYIISNIAPKMPENKFLILGSVKKGLKTKIPPNVQVWGKVDNETKKIVFNASDIALNPISYGSGTNLKLLEYLANGIPTLTTNEGARGIMLESNETVIISNLNDFVDSINFMLENPELMEKLRENGRELVEEKYDWRMVSKEIEQFVCSL